MLRKYYIEPREGKSETADFLLAVKHDARVKTITYLKDITDEELNWRPYEGWNSVADLLAHIIAVDRLFMIHFTEGRELTEIERNEIMPAVEITKRQSGQSVAYYLNGLQNSYEQSRMAIKNLPAGLLLKRRFDVYDTKNGADLAWILFHGAEDEIHHRGQISIVRKLYKEMKAKTT